MALLQIKYGPQTNNLPSFTDGSMYVYTSTTNTTVNSSTVYDANLFFDLGDKRYQIQSAAANKVTNKLTLQLNGTQLGSQFDGHEGVTWNIPLAADIAAGLISNAAQSIYGAKTFKTNVTVEGTVTATGLNPSTTNTKNIGTTNLKWANVYATTFHGALDGNATTATTASKVANKLTIQKNSNTKVEYNGSTAVTITLADLVDGTIPLSYIPAAAQERIVTYGSLSDAQDALDAGNLQPGDMVHISGTNNVMYYVKEGASGGNPTLENFTAGVATQANHVANKLSLVFGSGTSAVTTEYNGSEAVTWTVPFASSSAAGVVSTAAQTFVGAKTFSNAVTLSSGFTSSANSTITGTLTSASIIPSANNSSDLGSSEKKYKTVYATTFNGALSGNATSASKVTNKISFDGRGGSTGSFGLGGANQVDYDGSETVIIGVFKGSTSSADGQGGLVPYPLKADRTKYLKGDGTWASLPTAPSVTQGTGITVSKSGTVYTVSHAEPGTAGTAVGQSSDITLGRESSQATSFKIPRLSKDSLGHVVSLEEHTVTLGSVTVESTMTAANGATKIATVLGTDIYSGVAWGTF